MAVNGNEEGAEQQSGNQGRDCLWSLYGSRIVTAVLVGYVILLGIGVVAEVFKIQSILDWWIWSPPGKFR